MRYLTALGRDADWRAALTSVLAQLAAGRAHAGTITRPNLGVLYCTEPLRPALGAIARELRVRSGVECWVGGSGAGVGVDATEVFGEPALAVMLLQLPRRDFRIFSGAAQLRAWRRPGAALVHADVGEGELDDLLGELAPRVGTLHGGVVDCAQLADVVLTGGVSGVAFAPRVALAGGLARGWAALGPLRTVTRCSGQLVQTLDGRAALDVLLGDLGVAPLRPGGDVAELAPQLRRTLAVVGAAGERDSALRPCAIAGLDLQRGAIALGTRPAVGMRLQLCRRDADAARRDLVRLTTAVRDELEQRRDARVAAGQLAGAGRRGARGAVYIACAGRGGAYFGGADAELALLRRHLGDVPLVGLFGAGEIFGARVYGDSGVLLVFADDPEM